MWPAGLVLLLGQAPIPQPCALSRVTGLPRGLFPSLQNWVPAIWPSFQPWPAAAGALDTCLGNPAPPLSYSWLCSQTGSRLFSQRHCRAPGQVAPGQGEACSQPRPLQLPGHGLQQPPPLTAPPRPLPAQLAVQKYEELFPAFSDSRECKLIKVSVTHTAPRCPGQRRGPAGASLSGSSPLAL